MRRRRTRTANGRWTFDERATFTPSAPDGIADGGHDVEVQVRCTWRARGTLDPRGPDPDAPAEPGPHDSPQRLATLHLHAPPAASWHESILLAGFRVDAAHGWFDRRPLAPEADDSVWVAAAN
jgi:hypothetical protein